MKSTFALIFFSLTLTVSTTFAKDCDGVCVYESSDYHSHYNGFLDTIQAIDSTNRPNALENVFKNNQIYKSKCGSKTYMGSTGKFHSPVKLSQEEIKEISEREGVITIKRVVHEATNSYIGPATRIKGVYFATVSAETCQPLVDGKKYTKNPCEKKLDKAIKKEYAPVTKNIMIQPTHAFAVKNGIIYMDLEVHTYDTIESLDYGDTQYAEIRGVAFDAKTCQPIEQIKRKL